MSENALALTRIKQHYNMLSQSERKIADYMMAHHQMVAGSTAAELAEKTGTSPATVVRFCRALGFKGLADFKQYLSYEFISPSAKWMHVERDENISALKQKTFSFNQSSLDETMSILNDEALEMAIEAMAAAPKIIIIAEGGSASSARAGFDAFLKLGLQVMCVDDPFFQVLTLAGAPADTVVLAVCHSGQARNVVEALKIAKDKGLATIALVGIVGSPIMKYTDIPLFTGVSDHRFFSDSLSARMCEVGVLSTLHAGLAVRRKDFMDGFKKEVDKVMAAKRVKK